ncbi:hypothetical protein HD554DRAFT_2039595 [Boletus coccyginus]|nr:hypothetical protein HD554DRAFT_2039595 [Boletus coccyginus]
MATSILIGSNELTLAFLQRRLGGLRAMPLRDSDRSLRSPAVSDTQLPTRAPSALSLSYPSEPDGATLAEETPPFPATISVQSSLIQSHVPSTEGVDSSMPPPQMGLPGGSIPSDTEGNASLVTSGVAAGSTPAFHQQPLPVDADDEGLPSGLPTPPSEMGIDDGEPRSASCSTSPRGFAADFVISYTRFAQNYPVIPTPPSLTPEPSVGEDRGMTSGIGRGSTRQGLIGVVSEPLSPLTPPLLLPSQGDGASLVEESDSDVSGQAAAHKVVEEQADDAGAISHGGDATERVRPGPGADQASIAELTVGTSSGVPVITLTNESSSITASDEDSPQVHVDPSRTLRSSGQPNVELSPEHDDDIDRAAYSATTTGYGYDSIIRFSSPLRRPSPPTALIPSRYATPSDALFPDGRPAQDHDEDEVWRTLVLGSGASTPASMLASGSGSGPPPLSTGFSHDLSRAPSVQHAPQQQISIDPSVLHDIPHGCEVPLTTSPQVSGRSLSPLTSLNDTDVDDSAHTRHGRDSAPVDSSSSRGRRGSGSYRGRLSEPSRGTSVVGGPSASVDELTLLARRAPLRIFLKLPGAVRGLKRKQDGDDVWGEGKGDEATSTGVVGTSAPRTQMPTVSLRAPESRTSHSFAVHPAELIPDAPVPRKRAKRQSKGAGSASVPPSDVTAVAPSLPPARSISSGLADSAREHSDMASHLPASRKRTKKPTERGEYARARQVKPKRTQKSTRRLPTTYHVRNGQIVTLASEPESPSQAPATSSAPRLENMRTPDQVRHRKGQENQAIKTPLSSPAKPSHSSPRIVRFVNSSPTKQDVWDAISRRARTWPELPSVFSHWDAQFIQCDKWYHYGCVAIESGDPRLAPGVLFICPTCHDQSAPRKTPRNQDDTCGRPDCPEPQVTAEAELFFVEKIMGRKKIEGYVYMWLAKWEGYPMSQATWIPKENVVGDGTKLFNAFLEDAVEQGVDLSQDVVLLREALEAGWGAC